MSPKFVTDPLDPAGQGGQTSMPTDTPATGVALPGATPAASGNPTLPSDQIVLVTIEDWQAIRDMLNSWIVAAPSPAWAEARRQEVLEILESVTIYRRTISASDKAV